MLNRSARTKRPSAGSAVGAEPPAPSDEAADRAAAYRTAVRLLERRPYARRDLGRRLGLKGHRPEDVEVALDRAEQAGYLDDTRFATQFVETRSARGRGPARLRRELSMMGVANQIVDQVLAAGEADPAEAAARISELIAKRRRQLAGLPAADARRRLVAFLARRGYTGPEVMRLVRDRLL